MSKQVVPVLNKGDKIYYIDFEESGNSYTVCNVFQKANNGFCRGGLCYTIHSDQLSNMMGYYDLLAKQVDNPKDRFFSTPEGASEAYARFKEYVKQKEAERE